MIGTSELDLVQNTGKCLAFVITVMNHLDQNKSGGFLG